MICVLQVALIPSPDDKGVSQPSVYKLVSLPAPSHSKFHSVYVTEVRTPSSISIQLIGKETTQVLECLQEDMTTFYSSKGGKNYTIDEAFPGQVRGVVRGGATWASKGCGQRVGVGDGVVRDWQVRGRATWAGEGV